jgi:MarR family transcriptional regulator, 2-MHQ and catechol-resistance regulon repressor
MKIEEIIQAKFKDEYHKSIVNIRYTSNWIGNHYQLQFDPYDISLPQFNILRILRGSDEKLSIRVVKERMIEKSPNTTRLMDKLIEKKLVSRTRCKDDRRVVYVKITQTGLDLLDKLDREFTDVPIRERLTVDEAQELNRLLNKLRG